MSVSTINTIKTNILTTMAEITASPKPSYSIDGQSVSWGEYLAQLQQAVAWCDSQLVLLGESDIDESTYIQ